MIKNILRMLIRLSIIALLLYGSYYLYNHYTGLAVGMMELDRVRISLIIHSSIFFLVGIVLKFDTKLISNIRNQKVNLNYVKLSTAVVLLVILLLLNYNVFMYISSFIAFLAGFFLIESFEMNSDNR